MTNLRIGWFLGVVISAVSGCAGTDDVMIDYQVNGGLLGAQTSLHIARDGRAQRSTLNGPTQTTQLSHATLVDLQATIDQAAFPTLSPTYGCGGCADAPVFTVAVQLDDKNYSVQAEYSPSPDRLKPVLSTLADISQHAFD